MRDRSREIERYKTDEDYAERRREANRRYKAKMRSLSSYRMVENSKKRLDRGNPRINARKVNGIPRKYARFLARPEEFEKIHNYGIEGPIEIHHIHEFYPNGEKRFTVDEMIELGIYYYREACELVILPKHVHKALHKYKNKEDVLKILQQYGVFVNE